MNWSNAAQFKQQPKQQTTLDLPNSGLNLKLETNIGIIFEARHRCISYNDTFRDLFESAV